MSTLQDFEVALPTGRLKSLTPIQYAALAVVVAGFGLAAIWTDVQYLWSMWTTDALKSVGMIVPFISLILILRAWRTLGWRAEGTWWGLAVLLLVVAAVWAQQRAILLLVISPQWTTPLPPPSLILLAYGAGTVLLLGGVRLFRAALFPIMLLWFANPVPRAFSILVDLPLQTLSAHIARSFAIQLGQPLTPDHLRLMFTPGFGMFIAPGCNGIRGAVTMGFIALVAGYIYRFRWYVNASVVAGAILLGYFFNLLRLCLLVLYYLVALHFTSLQDKAENADYVIGGTLFLLASILLFTLIHYLRDHRKIDLEERASTLESTDSASSRFVPMRARYGPVAVMAVIAALSWGGRAFARPAVSSSLSNERVQPFPAHIGNYDIVRSWSEGISAGPIVYVWAQYAPRGGGTPISLGISPTLGWHDPLICHTIRGEHPLWQGQLSYATAGGSPISFDSAFYNDGVTQYLEAATECSGGSCGEFATERTHLGFVFSRPDPRTFLSPGTQAAIPVLIRVETTNVLMPEAVVRRQLNEDIRSFLTSANLRDLTDPYR